MNWETIMATVDLFSRSDRIDKCPARLLMRKMLNSFKVKPDLVLLSFNDRYMYSSNTKVTKYDALEAPGHATL